MTWLRHSARPVIKRISNPRFLSCLTSYDVASTLHLSLQGGAAGHGPYHGGILRDVRCTAWQIVPTT
jgi:hypothetical protein